MSTDTREVVALNADVVGYSRLMADDLETTTATVREYEQLVDTRVGEAGGRMVNFVGDNFMAVFDDPADAMQASIAITTDIETRNLDLEPHRQVRFRMGLDQGPVRVTDDQYFGDSLNVAARIQAIAPEGGISVSGSVYKSLDEPALRFLAQGKKDLKNIPEGVDVYRFADLPSDESRNPGEKGLELEFPTVSVLPIHTEQISDDLVSTAQMLRSDLLHRLSQIPAIQVVDPSMVDDRSYSGSHQYMIESGVIQFGDKLKIYAALVEASTWNLVSSHKWTANVNDLFEYSEQVAEEMAHAVEIELVIGEPGRIYADFGTPEVLEAVFMGWYHLTMGTKEGWSEATRQFAKASELIPDTPTGHVLEAFAAWVGASQGYSDVVPATLEFAMEKASLADQIGDPTGLAQMVEAAVLLQRGLVDEALDRVDGLEMTRPTCDVTYALEGSVRRYLGDFERSLQVLDTAMRLTAVNKPWYPTIQACSLYMSGQAESAATVAAQVLEYQPNNLEALLVLAASQARLGLDRRAAATAATIRERYPAMDIEGWIDANPYSEPELTSSWKSDLASVGLIAS